MSRCSTWADISRRRQIITAEPTDDILLLREIPEAGLENPENLFEKWKPAVDAVAAIAFVAVMCHILVALALQRPLDAFSLGLAVMVPGAAGLAVVIFSRQSRSAGPKQQP